jgi:hypothetical protein
MKIWIDKIELPKVDITGKDSAGREFMQGEMEVYYTAYKDGNYTFNGEFKCCYTNEINLLQLSERILKGLKEDISNEP